MSMTRKHFESLAVALKDVRPCVKIRKNSATYKQWLKSVRAVATACAVHNPNFDRYRFYKACNVDDKDHI